MTARDDKVGRGVPAGFAARALAKKRLLVFLVSTFALTWGWWFAVVYPMAFSDGSGAPVLSGMETTFAVGAGMLFPAIGVVIARLVTREGFRGSSLIKPVAFKRTWKYYLVGWFGPVVLTTLGAVAYYLLDPSDFDPTATSWLTSQLAALEAAGQSTEGVTVEALGTAAVAQIALGVLAAPLLNFVACFGEEWGWRGYLLPKLIEVRSLPFALVAGGLIWGVWHAPIIALGHNYGVGYWGWPVGGILAMCGFTLVIGVFFSYLTLRSGSCLPAVFAHGALNGFGTAGVMFSVSGGNPFVGPAPVGVVGGCAYIVVAVLCAVALMRRERAGKPQI